jgi:hypothetical protein
MICYFNIITSLHFTSMFIRLKVLREEEEEIIRVQ